jgi:hypothetical protein
MTKWQVGTALVAALLFALLKPAFAQTKIAHADETAPGCVIFFSTGPAYLTTVAEETIQMAAADANRSSGLVRVVGPVEYATTVKDELVRDGVPAPSILLVPQTESALLVVNDGIDEPASVEVYY